MIAYKTLLSGIGCAALFGTLAASGVPTQMNPPPRAHWAQMPEAQTVQYPSGFFRTVEGAPADLSPPTEAVVRNGVTELPPGTSLASLRAMERAERRAAAATAEYERLDLAAIEGEAHQTLVQASVQLERAVTADPRAERAASAAEAAAQDVAIALAALRTEG